MTKKCKQKIISKVDEKGFNFKNGELYNRMCFLSEIANELSHKYKSLPSIYLTHMKKIKERNCLKINKQYNSKICKRCNCYLDSKSNINNSCLSLLKIDNKLCYLQECGLCKYVAKVNLV